MSIDAQILGALRAAPEGSVSGADLAQQLGVSRAAIWARIEDLRTLGFEIEASPHRGYQLRASPDRLYADDLQARLGRVEVIGRDIRVFQETTSTNDIADKLARDGVKEGVVVFAESQSRGRGRLGRAWLSPSGRGLWFSILLRPPLAPQAATRLTILAATAVARAVRLGTGLTPEIKWPNDILIRGRKVVGILTELSAELDHIRHMILGVGIDVNQAAGDFPPELRSVATSLRIEAGQVFDRPTLAAAVVRELDADYARLCHGSFEDIATEWAAQCTTLGRNVTIRMGDRSLQGRAEALDDDGALIVRTEHGRLERVVGGDVTLAAGR